MSKPEKCPKCGLPEGIAGISGSYGTHCMERNGLLCLYRQLAAMTERAEKGEADTETAKNLSSIAIRESITYRRRAQEAERRCESLDAEIVLLRRERDEARVLLESIPLWGKYKWQDVPQTVARKLAENAAQIVDLMHERDGVLAEVKRLREVGEWLWRCMSDSIDHGYRSHYWTQEMDNRAHALVGEHESEGDHALPR